MTVKIGAAGARPVRRGFTLVELLVVIAIIVILMAMLIPAVGAVRYRVWQTRITTEIANIHRGVQGFADKYGQPPDFSDIGLGFTNTAGYRFLRKNWKLTDLELLRIRRLVEAGEMDHATCLWFWLSSPSESTTTPFTSDGGPLSANPLNDAYYDFNMKRLVSRAVTIDTSAAGGGPETYQLRRYLPHQVEEPYVYFDSRTYAVARYVQSPTNVLRPYMTYEELAGGARQYQFYNPGPDGWQVVAAGNDDRFAGPDFVSGGQPAYPLLPDKVGFHPTASAPSTYFEFHMDNFTNFAEGVELGDLLQ